MNYQSVNPYDGKTLKTFEAHSDAQLERAIETASVCFEKWRHTTFAERAVIATKAAGIIRSRVEEFARPVTLEMGKLIAQARGEVLLSADSVGDRVTDHDDLETKLALRSVGSRGVPKFSLRETLNH